MSEKDDKKSKLEKETKKDHAKISSDFQKKETELIKKAEKEGAKISSDIQKVERDLVKKVDRDHDKIKKDYLEKEEKTKIEKARKPFKLPFWLRIYNVFIGLLFISISSWIITNSNLAVSSATNFLGLIVLLLGITRLINAFYDDHIQGTKRLIRFLIGISLTILGISVFTIPNLGEDATLIILGLSLILQGLGRVFLGLNHELLPFWSRWLLIVFGSLSAVLGFASLSPGPVEIKKHDEIVNLLASGFILTGITRIVIGIAGLSQMKQKK